MKIKLLSALSLVTLMGCGGSSTENLGNVSDSLTKTAEGYSKEITDWFDIEIGLYHPLQEPIHQSNIEMTFDVNQNGLFDDGDIRIIAGNASGSFTDIISSWAYSADYLVQLNSNNTMITFREMSGVIIGSSNTNYVSQLGGVKTYQHLVNDQLTEQKIILRTNRSLSDSLPQLDQLMQQLRLIDANTPMNVALTDGLTDASSDYVPEPGVFTQQPILSLQDNQNDYTGNNQWVDIKSVHFSSSTGE
ncbi:hypothetical protein [Photobacterium halotolerans]|uniref:hypothetical protein n=1 Tax=Photobacterium halotolerans TaxID=265726 RepID=UPI001373119F|nr:hypothetical protein [Photobacterium halotolerans]NAW87815.1 hypothetical protein [Photobacterium halotolerans]